MTSPARSRPLDPAPYWDEPAVVAETTTGLRLAVHVETDRMERPTAATARWIRRRRVPLASVATGAVYWAAATLALAIRGVAGIDAGPIGAIEGPPMAAAFTAGTAVVAALATYVTLRYRLVTPALALLAFSFEVFRPSPGLWSEAVGLYYLSVLAVIAVVGLAVGERGLRRRLGADD